jgi:hypothetical protein
MALSSGWVLAWSPNEMYQNFSNLQVNVQNNIGPTSDPNHSYYENHLIEDFPQQSDAPGECSLMFNLTYTPSYAGIAVLSPETPTLILHADMVAQPASVGIDSFGAFRCVLVRSEGGDPRSPMRNFARTLIGEAFHFTAHDENGVRSTYAERMKEVLHTCLSYLGGARIDPYGRCFDQSE